MATINFEPLTPINISDLTSGNINGAGAFDKLMVSVSAQLESQFSKGRITGSDYASVYLGSLQATLNTALNFLTNQYKISLEADLLNTQIEAGKKQVEVLQAQVCKLKAEYDLTLATTAKTGKESDLLAQKLVTEKAQVLELGVDDNSLIGRQKGLYAAQTAGFKSDRIQKGTKILVDSWQARRMTDDGVVADDINKLADSHIGQAVTDLLNDIHS